MKTIFNMEYICQSIGMSIPIFRKLVALNFDGQGGNINLFTTSAAFQADSCNNAIGQHKNLVPLSILFEAVQIDLKYDQPFESAAFGEVLCRAAALPRLRDLKELMTSTLICTASFYLTAMVTGRPGMLLRETISVCVPEVMLAGSVMFN